MDCGTPAVPSERSLAPSSLPIEQSTPLICFPFLMSATPQLKGETAKVTVIIKGHNVCGSERTYEASTEALPKAFVDGTTWSGGSVHNPYIEVQEVHPGEY
ncbi:hypothetical protein SK128_000519, partial [Halocaridina rubra]